MDIKTRLNEETIFNKKPKGNLTITSLNKKGIFTVEDFINCNVNNITKDINRKIQFKAFQDILKYKYLNIPLNNDILLEKEYTKTFQKTQLKKDTITLGFGEYSFSKLTEMILEKQSTCKMIDIITNLDNRHSYLRDFYIKYYENNLKNIEKSQEISNNNDIEKLNILKDKLIILINKRNELDKEIISLLEQINNNKVKHR